MKGNGLKRDWQLIDVSGKVLGRVATEIATKLMGKDKPSYTAHMDMGDYLVVVNAEKVLLTGNKLSQKTYKSHSGFPGGFKEVAASKLMIERPEEIIRKAVKGMLPDNRIKRSRLARLKIYSDSNHPYKDKFKNKI